MNFSSYFKGIALAFVLSWVGLVALPWFQVGNLEPFKTEEGILPWDSANLAHAGERVYASEGCVYCHTQQVRGEDSGADFIRGWGTAHDEDNKELRRRSYPRDYIWQHRVFLGNSRTGADLSNVGDRYKDANSIYLELYDPYTKSPNSAMPAYSYLFITQKITGQPSNEALPLIGDDTPAPGYEVIPTQKAKALAAYMLSLKKDYHLQQDESNDPVKPDAN